MILRSTTLRFAALVFMLQLAAAGALLVSLGAIVRSQLAAEAAAATRVLRDDLVAIDRQSGRGELVATIEQRARRTITPGTVLLLADAHGARVAGDLAQWPPSVATGPGLAEVELYRTGHNTPEAMRVRATRLADGAMLLTGVTVQGEHRVLRVFEGATMLALSLALIFAALAAWLAARMIVARLEATVATLGAVRDGDLSRRVPADHADDAFAALAREVNKTLDRVDALVGELAIATDTLAHDLKSPLTRMRAALERAQATVHEPEAQDAVDRAVAEGERLLAMVETALRITRAEAGIGRDSFTTVDLAAELADIAEIYGPLVEDAGRVIGVDAPAPLTMAVHRELLGQALGNLVDNSLKYGAGAITLSLAPRAGGGARIAVADEGPGIAADRRDEALRRFGRLDEARQGAGAGLGLSLVAAVARLHGGTIRLEDAAPGLRVVIEL